MKRILFLAVACMALLHATAQSIIRKYAIEGTLDGLIADANNAADSEELRDRIKELEDSDEADELQSRVDELEDEKDDLNDEIEKLKKENGDLNDKVEELEGEIDKLKNGLEGE